MDGWIKLHRQLLEWEWYDDTNVVRLFLHLLLTANYEPKNWHGITIERGQLVTSVNNIASQIQLSAMQVRTALNKLQSTNEITNETTNKYTLITICNYERYQRFEDTEQQTNNKRITNKQQTNNNQITTTKEIKKERKKENNIDYAQAITELEPAIRESVMQCANEIETWIEYKKNEFRKSYKTATTFKTFLKHLFKLAGGNPETMKAIIEQSIANRYEGIFELKNTYNHGANRYNNPESDEYVPTERIVAAGIAMAKARF